jgi:hypothetical protein
MLQSGLYGACTLDLVGYKSIILFVYCDKKKTMYYMELFAPIPVNTPAYAKSLVSLECIE